MFPDANDNGKRTSKDLSELKSSLCFLILAYAARFCTNESRWEERGEYGLCIGCPTQNISISVRVQRKID